MDPTFSFKRIGLLLRKDWIEYKKKLMYAVLTIVGILLTFLILSTLRQEKMFHPLAFYGFGLLGTLIGICRYTSLGVHRSKGLYLALPASNEEKFLTLLIEAVIMLAVFQVVFWTCIGVGSFFIPIKPINVNDIIIELPFFVLLLFISSLLFLSYITFRKYALGIAIGGFMCALASWVGIIYYFKDFLLDNKGSFYYETATPLFKMETWLAQGFTPIFLIATLVVLYVAYLKLKEKELK